MVSYTSFPTLSAFVRDCNTPPAKRGQDRYLAQIDALLPQLGFVTERDLLFTLTSELFFSINSWVIALRNKTAGVTESSYDPVMALLIVVEKQLMSMLGVSNRGTLAHELVKVTGRQITDVGTNVDVAMNALMMDTKRRALTKLFFESGTIKRYLLDVMGALPGLQPVNSSDFANENIRRPGMGMSMPDFAPFVMSMEREFFMSYHFHGQGGVYHSAYTGGKPVAMAGTMLVRNGKLIAIRGDSGHYKPTPEHMAAALRALKGHGISLKEVQVFGWQEGMPPDRAREIQQLSFSLADYVAPVIEETQVYGTRPRRVSGVIHYPPAADAPAPFYSGADEESDAPEYFDFGEEQAAEVAQADPPAAPSAGYFDFAAQARVPDGGPPPVPPRSRANSFSAPPGYVTPLTAPGPNSGRPLPMPPGGRPGYSTPIGAGGPNAGRPLPVPPGGRPGYGNRVAAPSPNAGRPLPVPPRPPRPPRNEAAVLAEALLTYD